MKRILFLPVIFAALLALGFHFPFSQPHLKLHFLDVGEGDSIFIQTPQGKNVLIDAGNPVSGYRVAQYLKKHRVKQIDHLVISHPHPDHFAGIFFVMQMLKVDRVYDNGDDLSTRISKDDFYYGYEKLVRGHPQYRQLRAGDRFTVDSTAFQVLWPPTPLPFDSYNPNSLVLKMEFGSFRALLTGDLLTVAEEKLVQTGADLRADLLKCGHHGSRDATSAPFLNAVAPRLAVLSAHYKGRKNYPHPSVLERLQKKWISVYTTEKQGDIVVKVGRDGNLRVQTSK